MNVLEKKYPQKDIFGAMKALKFANNPLELVGTSSLKSQLYAADYDFMSKISSPKQPNEVYAEFSKIFNNIRTVNGLFFIEFKIQNLDGSKVKLFKMEDFTEDFFMANYSPQTVEYCKIDGIIFIEGICKEISVIYFFANKTINREDYIRSLLDDNVHYYEDEKYYKSLKRMMLACKYAEPPRLGAIKAISSLFNSKYGYMYQLKNEIDACIIYLEKYKGTPEAFRRAEIFLINKGLRDVAKPTIKSLEKLSKEYAKVFDDEAKKFYKKYAVKVGKIPTLNSKLNNYL